MSLLSRRPLIAGPAVVLASAAATLVLGGCAVLSSFVPAVEPERDASGAVTEGEEHTDVFALRVGDCLAAEGRFEWDGTDDAELEDVAEAPTVPCSEAHETEIYHAVQLSGDRFPGDEQVGQRADETCHDAFSAFVGLSYEESYLDFTWLVPTEDGWAGGDHEVLCLIGDPSGLVTGSLEGAGV